MKLTTRLLAALITSAVLVFPLAAQAAGTADKPIEDTSLKFTPEITIPGLLDGTWTVSPTSIAQYIRVIFIAFIWFVGTLATVMVVYGGIRWVAAAGNPGRINEARTIINDAIIGVLIALSSVVLLNIINPNLTSFEGIILRQVKYVEGDEPSSCSGQKALTYRYGNSQEEIQTQLQSVTYTNTVTHSSRTYKVHQKALAAFQAVFNQIKDNPYDISRETSGGTFAWRQNRNNAACYSLHAFGVAIDVNPSKNPNCPKSDPCYATPVTDIPEDIINAFKSQGFVWGGDWKSVKDYMHFELH